jgi:hypothetical protein
MAPFTVVTIVASVDEGCIGGGIGSVFDIGGSVISGVICGIVGSGGGVIRCVMYILGKQDVLCLYCSKSPRTKEPI